MSSSLFRTVPKAGATLGMHAGCIVDALHAGVGMQIVIIRREWTCQFSSYFYDRIFLFLVMANLTRPFHAAPQCSRHVLSSAENAQDGKVDELAMAN